MEGQAQTTEETERGKEKDCAYLKETMAPLFKGLPSLTKQSLLARRLKILGSMRVAEENMPQFR